MSFYPAFSENLYFSILNQTWHLLNVNV